MFKSSARAIPSQHAMASRAARSSTPSITSDELPRNCSSLSRQTAASDLPLPLRSESMCQAAWHTSWVSTIIMDLAWLKGGTMCRSLQRIVDKSHIGRLTWTSPLIPRAVVVWRPCFFILTWDYCSDPVFFSTLFSSSYIVQAQLTVAIVHYGKLISCCKMGYSGEQLKNNWECFQGKWD